MERMLHGTTTPALSEGGIDCHGKADGQTESPAQIDGRRGQPRRADAAVHGFTEPSNLLLDGFETYIELNDFLNE